AFESRIFFIYNHSYQTFDFYLSVFLCCVLLCSSGNTRRLIPQFRSS
ncbi:hypothetical protein GE061_004264, partial [Apolygus lucorum]